MTCQWTLDANVPQELVLEQQIIKNIGEGRLLGVLYYGLLKIQGETEIFTHIGKQLLKKLVPTRFNTLIRQ